MASRRDLTESYQFLGRRIVAALVTGERDPTQSPLRRGIGAFFASFMVAVLVGAGFGVVGLFTHTGGNDWQVDGAVVVEKETGASFVFHNGALYPAWNYASALLAAGKAPPSVFRESATALGNMPRGTRIGIPGAPDSLPVPGQLLGRAWDLCATGPVTTVVVGGTAPGGTALADRALLLTDATTTALLWHGHINVISEPSTVVPALFGASGVGHPVGAPFLAGLPAGPDIAALGVADRGAASTVLAGERVGNIVYAVTGSGRQDYLVLEDGLAAITAFQRDVQLSRAAVSQDQIDVAVAIHAPVSRQTPALGSLGPPAATPALAPANAGAICAATADATGPAQLSIGAAVPAGGLATATGAGGLADRVAVPPGHAALVQSMVSPSAVDGPYSLVTDLGTRFPVASTTALGLLGYAPGQAVRLPAALVERLPTGPTLDPAAAAVPN